MPVGFSATAGEPPWPRCSTRSKRPNPHLGKSEDEIKQFAREGRLREFRDGPRLMFKADQVEQLRSEIGGGGDQVDLGVSDSGGMIGLVDTTGASGTSITLADTNAGQGTALR